MKERLYNLSVTQLKKKLNTNLEQGLNRYQVENRLADVGYNQLPEETGASILKLFVEQFQDFMVLVLLIATVVSFFLGEVADAVTILAIVVLNSCMGFIQEYRAEKSLEALKSLSSPTAQVLRAGKIKEVATNEVVPGDVILVERGDKIPADARLLAGDNLEVNEASLTGESVPVAKKVTTLSGEVPVGDRENILHMGTTVTKGQGKAVITATGLATEMGQIADMLQQTTEEITPLQKRLKELGKWLVVFCLLACLGVAVLGVLKGEPVYQMVLAGVSLAVAAIPEGLPAIVTLALAIGVQKMIERNAIIRKLPAVETLGCATVVCSDKTGTLTKNDMVVEQIYTNDELYYCQAEGFDQPNLKKLLQIGTICNNARLKKRESLVGKVKQVKESMFNQRNKREIIGDPTEGALLAAADEAGLNKDRLEAGFSELLEIPFTSARKRMSKLGKKGSQYELYTKGAPEIILERCNYFYEQGQVKRLTSSRRREIKKINQKLASQGLRVLAFGYRELSGELDRNNLEQYEEKLVFVGLAGLMDPPRSEVKTAIKKCKQAGITPKMVTGDHKETAVAIAKKLNLLEPEDQVLTGQDLQQMSDRELKQDIEDTAVLARVSPQDKLRVVKVLQEQNQVVGMTGDGINDAPAVKEADIGIAMGKQGTDVTQEASSLILADDNFATIVAAVEEGRAIYDNIRKFIRYLLSCNIGEILTMFLASLLALPLPLIPIQILWVNLVTDGLPALALGVDPADDDIMDRAPREPDESVFSRGLKWKIMGQGILIGLGTLFVFLLSLRIGGSLAEARTMAFTNLVMVQLFFVFSCRSEDYSLLRMNLLSNVYLIGAVTLSFGLHLLVLYHEFFQNLFETVQLARKQWGVILVVSISSTLVIEVLQFIYNSITRN